MHKSWPSIQSGCLKLRFDMAIISFSLVRRLSGAPFVVSAVFLPQRVQFLADSGADSWFFLPTPCSYRIGLRCDGIVDNLQHVITSQQSTVIIIIQYNIIRYISIRYTYLHMFTTT